jgi:cobalt transporter subunit CbtA
MTRRVLLVALLAGLVGGLFVSLAQWVRVVPLIHLAETFETKDDGGKKAEAPAPHSHGAGHEAHSHDAAWEPADGLERTAYTVLANIVIGIGFALLLVGAVTLATTSGRRIDPWRGVLWGLAGFATFALAPALGLPPELPGAMSAELGARQAWWLSTAAATAIGLALVAFGRGWLPRIAAIALIALPHLIGAPQPAQHGGTAPAEVARAFISASLLTTALFWIVLGATVGTAWRRIVGPAA